MKTQTVVMTPNAELTAKQALEHIAFLLPAEVLYHLSVSMDIGDRSTEISTNGNTHTVTTTWQDSAAEEYKIMMDGVSEVVKAQLISEGWAITFTPETADL